MDQWEPVGADRARTRLTPDEPTTWRFDAEPLPIAARLETAFSRRLSVLRADTRAALLIVSVATGTEFEALTRALEAASLPVSTLEPAKDQAFISIADGQVQFRHPLVRSAVYQVASPSDRRRAHRALADRWRTSTTWGCARRISRVPPSVPTRRSQLRSPQQPRPLGGGAATRRRRRRWRRPPGSRPIHSSGSIGSPRRSRWRGREVIPSTRSGCSTRPSRSPPDPYRSRVCSICGGASNAASALPSTARGLLLQAAALIEDDDPGVAAEILSHTTVAAFLGGDLPEALRVARRLRRLAPGDGSALDAQSDYVLGWLLSLAGHVDQARPYLVRAVDALLTRIDRAASSSASPPTPSASSNG